MFQQALHSLSVLFARAPQAGERRRWELPVVLALMVIGTVMRFWGLGDVGLHGDEETMAMPVMHILQDGSPRFPSGMFYGRAIAQLYMMAASVMAFGSSEWSLRIPSVLCGVLLIYLAWPLGRRFLGPAWNMAFVAVVAFLPGFIELSQTARMYIFLQASIAGFAILLFRWERTGKIRDLALALLVLLIGIQFQTLAIFAALLFFFPGFAQGDLRKTLYGAGAFGLAFVGFVGIDHWAAHFYPEGVRFQGATPGIVESHEGMALALKWGVWPIVVGAVLGIALALYAVRPVKATGPRLIAGVLVTLTLLFGGVLSWHLALLSLVAATIIARRQSRAVLPRLLVVVAVCVAMAVVEAYLLHQGGLAPSRKIVGAMMGWPSIWTFLQLSTYSPVASLLAAAGCAAALWRMSAGERVSDAWLFFALGSWVPLVMLGFFEWFVAVRYTDSALLPLLICAMVSLQTLLERVPWGRAERAAPRPAGWVTPLAAGIAAVAAVNPLAFAQTYDAGYADHPDHKGAAEYMRRLGIGPHDIVVAEDVLQQKYYLGHVDYWLLGKNIALGYCVQEQNGEIRDFYTGAQLLGTGADLEALVRKPDRGAIYVIGSGEEQADGRRFSRSFGIFEALQSSDFQVVYEGRDGLTKIWKVEEPNKLAHAIPADAASGVAPQ